jgi:hypothetical protein
MKTGKTDDERTEEIRKFCTKQKGKQRKLRGRHTV